VCRAITRSSVTDLAEVDVVWLRQDPPFDMFYITTTHILDRLQGGTLVVNDPFWVRNSPEKLLVLDFPDLTPPTRSPATSTRCAPSARGPWRHHPEAALWQWRGGRVPPDPNDRNLSLAARAVHRDQPSR
jgi:hypothetical protein